MPELPEVQTIIDGVAPIVRGAVVAAVRVDRLDVVRHGVKRLPRELPGKRIVRLERQGKRIIFRLDPPATLVIHLGMSGRLTVQAADAPVVKHTHLRLRLVCAPSPGAGL
jgi:formamidopyrimidine-DNA glycosylase